MTDLEIKLMLAEQKAEKKIYEHFLAKDRGNEIDQIKYDMINEKIKLLEASLKGQSTPEEETPKDLPVNNDEYLSMLFVYDRYINKVYNSAQMRNVYTLDEQAVKRAGKDVKEGWLRVDYLNNKEK